MRKSVNARWAAKVMKARNFVILTDKESVICMSGMRAAKLDDHILLASQAAELEVFDLKLQSLIKDHRKAVDKMLGGRYKEVTKAKETIKRRPGRV
jgi:hypothetical protein